MVHECFKKGTGKFVPVHAMNAYWRSKDTVPLIINVTLDWCEW